MPADTTARVFRATKTGAASLFLENNSVSIVGDDRHFITVDDRGITIKGPISLITDGMGIRQAGLFVGMPDFVAMIPSTMFTPIPKIIPFPPAFGLVNIGKDVAFFGVAVAAMVG